MAPRFQPRSRWYARLRRTDRYEVWLLTWLPGQRTQLHDHGTAAGAFYVVRGALVERVPDPPATGLKATSVPAGGGRSFDAGHIHELVNLGDRPAISIHAYGPVLDQMTRYRLDGSGLYPVETTRAGRDW
jgi:predicted metal-dependent enzyme (double-stranded beta helix superfamily)